MDYIFGGLCAVSANVNDLPDATVQERILKVLLCKRSRASVNS